MAFSASIEALNIISRGMRESRAKKLAAQKSAPPPS